MIRMLTALVLASTLSCQSVREQKSFELVDVVIEDATPESVDLVEVRLQEPAQGELTECALNFATSETFERTVAYRRMTGGQASSARFQSIPLSPSTSELWLQLKIQTTTGATEEQRFRIF